MTVEEALTLFKTFILPSVKKLVEDVGLEICTLTSYLDERIDSSEFVSEISFLPMFNSCDRKLILLKQKLQGKLWNLFSEYGVIINEITFEHRRFPDLIIRIHSEELIKCFEYVGKKQEDFSNEIVRQQSCIGSSRI